MLSEQLFVYLRPYGVGVSCLAPAGVMTNIVEHMRPGRRAAPAARARLPDRRPPTSPARRVGRRGRVARAFLVLTADEVRDELRREATTSTRTSSSARRGCTTRSMADLDLDARLDELFAPEPKDFTATRDALVRDSRPPTATDEAAEVKALRKPTVAVAAVNRVARTHADQVAALVEIGDRARRAAGRRPRRPRRAARPHPATTHAAPAAHRARRGHHGTARRRPLVDRGDARHRCPSTSTCATTCNAAGSPRSSRPRRASCSATTPRPAARRRGGRAPRNGLRPPPPRDELAARRARRRARGGAGARRRSRGVGARARRCRRRGDRATRCRAPSHRRARSRAGRRPRRARRGQTRRARRPPAEQRARTEQERAVGAPRRRARADER